MAKDPAQRYVSAGDLGRAAIAALKGIPPADTEDIHPGYVIAKLAAVALCTAICIARLPPVLGRGRDADGGCMVCSLKDYLAVGAALLVWPALVWVVVELMASIGGLLPERLRHRLLDALGWLVRVLAGVAALTLLILSAIKASSTVRIIIIVGLTPALVLGAIETVRRLRR